MCKLLRANMERVLKSKIFWTGMLVLAGLGCLAVTMTYREMVEYGGKRAHVFAGCLFSHATYIGIVAAVFGSLFVGTEYSDGTIRNKLIAGQSRRDIYLANFISCSLAGMVQALVAEASVFALGFALMGKPEMTPVHALQLLAGMMFLCMSYAAVYNLVSMLVGSKSHAAVVNLLLGFILLFGASFLLSRLSQPKMQQQYEISQEGVMTMQEAPNPQYLTGTKREVYQFLHDFLPGGQTFQVSNPSCQEELFEHPALTYFYAVILAAALNIAGILLFCRKDIK